MPRDVTDFLDKPWKVVEAVIFNTCWPEVGLSPGWYLVYDSGVWEAIPQVILGPTSKHMAEHLRDCHNSCLAWDALWDKIEELSKEPCPLDDDSKRKAVVEIRLSSPVEPGLVEILKRMEPGTVVIAEE